MRNAVVLLAFLGAIVSLASAGTWFSKRRAETIMMEARLRSRKMAPEERASARSALTMLANAPYFLAAGCLLGAYGAYLAYGKRGRESGALLLLAASGPLLMMLTRLGWLSKKPQFLFTVVLTCLAFIVAGVMAMQLPPKTEEAA